LFKKVLTLFLSLLEYKYVKVLGYFMRLIEKLQEYENQYMFIRWATGGEYGKLISVGEDFVELAIIDIETMAYKETVLIYAPLILEVAIGGSDISRIIAEVSSQMSSHEK
jgi:hypothetical protein